MAITITQQPNVNHAAYNPLYFKADSTNKNLPGFRYVFNIFEGATSTTNRIWQGNIAPNPLDNGLMEADISRIIQNKVDRFIPLTITNITNATTPLTYQYNIRIDESYVYSWPFTTHTLVSNQVQLNGSVAHTYVVGDLINISHPNATLNGIFSVVSIPSSTSIKINLLGLAGSSTPGVTAYSDARRVVVTGTAVTNLRTFNSAKNINEYAVNGASMANYNPSTSNPFKLLTNLPENFKFTSDQFMYIPFFNVSSGSIIRIFNSNLDGFTVTIPTAQPINMWACGPGNINTSVVVPDTPGTTIFDGDWYSFRIENNSPAVNSQMYFVNFDKRCKINDTQILFMDRMGAWSSFAFQMQQDVNVETTTKAFNQQAPATNFQTYSNGSRVYHSEVKKSLNLITNHMTDEMNLYFEEFLSSPYHYIKFKGVWYACTINTGQFKIKNNRRDRLNYQTVTASFSLNNPINI
jgi:hypothetical protein